jgi:hypothetical protein
VKRLLLALLVLACERIRLTPAAPHAIIDGRAIDFGQTPVLFPVRRDVLVSNAGRVALHVTAISVQGEGFEGPAPTLDVEAGDTVRMPVTFRPPRTGPFSGTLSLATDDAAVPGLAIALTGVGTENGAISISPSALDFGRVGEGQTSTRELTIASTGAADLYLASLGLAPGTPDSFGYVGSVTAPATLVRGSRIVLGVHFSPTPDTPAASGALAIDSSDPAQQHVEIPLSGSINRAPIAVARGSVGTAAPATSVLDALAGDAVQLDGSLSSDRSPISGRSPRAPMGARPRSPRRLPCRPRCGSTFPASIRCCSRRSTRPACRRSCRRASTSGRRPQRTSSSSCSGTRSRPISTCTFSRPAPR